MNRVMQRNRAKLLRLGVRKVVEKKHTRSLLGYTTNRAKGIDCKDNC